MNQVDDAIKMMNEKFYIYGAGRVAKRFYRILKQRSLISNLCGFVVSSKVHASESDIGTIFTIDEIDSTINILVAVDYTAYLEIKNKLLNLGFSSFLWVYPLLYDFFFGRPVKFEKIIIADVLDKSYMINWIAACYLALKEKGGEAEKIYIKMATSVFGYDNAIKDYLRFMRDKDYFVENGYEQKYPIKINESYSLLLDGAHRIALAIYFSQKYIIADIYHCDVKKYINFCGENKKGFMITNSEDEYIKEFLDEEEKRRLKETINSMLIVLST